MAPIQHFKTAFWSQKQPELTLPDFSTGYSILHQKLSQSKIENEEMIYFFKDRIAIEESYANKMTDQGKSTFKSGGFGRDEGAGLLKCFSQLKETSRRIGEQHKTTAVSVSQHVLTPLQDFHEEYKRNVSHSKQAVDSMLKQFDGLIKEAEKTRSVYHRKCKEADKAEELALKNASSAAAAGASATVEEKSLPSTPSSTIQEDTTTTSPTSPSISSSPAAETTATATTKIQLGNQIMPQSELDSLVRRIKQEITIKDHRVPILGTYKNTSTGEDIAIWLQHNLPQCKDSPAMADIVGQQLIQPYNILRLIGQRGNKFTASSNSFYQWRSVDDDTSSIASSEVTYSTLGGLMDKITPPSTTTNNGAQNEEPHKRARREAEKSDQAYRTAVMKLDQLRMAIEEAMFAHLTEMEQVELQRIQQLKELISAFIVAMSVAIPQDKLVIEEMTVFQESLKPDQDIQYIIQQYAVSGFAPKAILYDNYYHGISHDQVFGVPLEELGKQTQDNVPHFVNLVLAAIKKGSEKIEDAIIKQKLWSTPVALDRVHATCMELNVGSDALTVEMLEKHDPELLVAVLRYFLLELPECLVTYEFYDPVEALLGGGNDDQGESLRMASFSNLIATLPGSHFATLKVIFENITSFTAQVEASEDTLSMICQSLGPVILRARVDSFSILNNKVPVKFVHELMKYSQDIFSESTMKLHAESEKRRHARPIVAPADESATATKSSNNKRASSLMSFMRPTINTAEELNKWTVNSMMGVFNRNANSQSPTEQQLHTPSSRSVVPLNFGSTIITQQDSPPSSPAMVASNTKTTTPPLDKIEENKVMFDGDHIFDDEDVAAAEKEDNQGTKEEGIEETKEEGKKKENDTQQEPTKRPATTEHIDSSFFDDDDEEDED